MTEKPTLPAVSVALRRGDSLLLVKRGRAPSRGLYAFPGGGVEPGEDEADAARRELLEETGMAVTALAPLCVYVIEGERATYRLQVFSGTDAGGEPIAADDAEDAGFFTLAEMEAMPMTASTLEVARQLLAADGAGEVASRALRED